MAEAFPTALRLMELGRLDEAARVLEERVRAAPKDASAILLLAELWERRGNADKATQYLRKATNAAPGSWEAQHTAGVAYLRLGRLEEAIKRLENAHNLAPRELHPILSLGLVQLDRVKRPSVARKLFLEACELDSESVMGWYHLAKCEFVLGRVDASILALRQAEDIAATEGNKEVLRKCLEVIAITIPGAFLANNAAILDARQAWARGIEPEVLPTRAFEKIDRTPDRPLTIGYVSSFFRDENWRKPVWALINEHDRARFQVRLISYGPVPGSDPSVPTAFRPQESDRIFDVAALDDEAVVNLIQDEKIDVLIDLNGYSDPQRLNVLVQRPAPVLFGWFNLYATTGMRSFDYLIGDRHVVTPEEEAFYTEQIVRVPGSYLTFNVNYPVPDVAPPPCLKNGFITFGSLCSRYKLTPETLRAWGEIFKRAPNSRLVLRNGGFSDDIERATFLEACRAQGVPVERVELLGRAPHFEFLETYEQFDIALDAFPYNGGTTTTEAIWQGVPVIAYHGPTWAGRTSATLLHEGNLSDWVAPSIEGYIELAVGWANDPNAPEKLTELRANMRERLKASSVCDTKNFARAMEQLYQEGWNRWRVENGEDRNQL